MQKIFLIVSIVVVLILAIVFALVANRPNEVVPPSGENFPDSGSKVSPERPLVSSTSVDHILQPQSTPQAQHLSSPGSIAIESPQDRWMIQQLLKTAQKFPGEGGVEEYILLLSDEYDITMEPSETHEWVVSVTIKRDPIHYYRMLAEADVAHRIQVEREDICGVPFDIHTLPGHPASALGNLGLQHCGADKLANTEWEKYELPTDN